MASLNPESTVVGTEDELAIIAATLAGSHSLDADNLSVRRLANCAKQAIETGGDPLGDEFCRLRTPERRRRDGAVYTPTPIVGAMVTWAAGAAKQPTRIVDPGAGSGRFLLTAGKAFPEAQLVAVEVDPLARLVLEANAKVLGMDKRLVVLRDDYRSIDLPQVSGSTLFLGNPPYVRHHDIPKVWKKWFAEAAAELGFKASKLAGLHVHFMLKTCQLAKPGDYGAFITAAEWLEVNYGDLVRKLLTQRLGGVAVHAIRPGAMPFAGTATTAAVTCFRVGETPESIRFRQVGAVDELDDLRGGKSVPRPTLVKSRRWSTFLRTAEPRPHGHVELGELCAVHRGQVTGCNRAWIAGTYPGQLPRALLQPVVTRAHELFNAGPSLRDSSSLCRMVSLPEDLDELEDEARASVESFLTWAKALGAHRSYVATHRRRWWSVPLKPPAPILCTYMARRPPAFVRNLCNAGHLNIAHGIYPRDATSASFLDALSAWLQDNVPMSAGRVYAGGLIKFEPREVERILIPPLEELCERTATLDIRRARARRREGTRFVPAVAAD